MLALVATLGAALVAGITVGFMVRRWPAADPATPHGTTHAVAEHVRRSTALSSAVRARMDPAEATGLALTVALGTVVLAGVVFGALAYMVRAKTGLVVADRGLATRGGSNATGVSTAVLRVVTRLGSTVVVVALAVLVGVAEYRRVPNRAVPWFLALVVIGQNVVTNAVKVLVDRARPHVHPLAGFSGASFPSGHTAAAAASFAAFALLFARRRSLRTQSVLAGCAGAITTVVAASRALLGVHWLTDVVAGAALGWGWFAISAIAFGGRFLDFAAPVKKATRVAEHAPGTS